MNGFTVILVINQKSINVTGGNWILGTATRQAIDAGKLEEFLKDKHIHLQVEVSRKTAGIVYSVPSTTMLCLMNEIVNLTAKGYNILVTPLYIS